MPIKMSSSLSQFHQDIQLKTIILHGHNFQLRSPCPNKVVKNSSKVSWERDVPSLLSTTYTKKHVHIQRLTRERQYIAVQCVKYYLNLTKLKQLFPTL